MCRASRRSATAAVFAVAFAVALAFAPQGAFAAQDADGFCQSYLVLGELAQPNGANPSLAQKQADYLADGLGLTDTNIIPFAGQVVNPDFGGAAASTGFVAGTGTDPSGPTIIAPTITGNQVNYSTIYSDLDNLMTYAWTYVTAPAGPNIDAYLAVAPDDGSVAYCNGVYIGESTGWHNNNDVWATMRITLIGGQKNLIMVKVYEGGGGHDLRIRLQQTPDTGAAANSTQVPGITYGTDGFGYTYPTLNVASAVRSVGGSAGIFLPGTTIDVTVTVDRQSGSPAPIVDETFPTGWTLVGSPTVGQGTTSVAANTIHWDFGGAMAAQSVTMTYTLQPPGAGVGAFSGTVDTDVIQNVAGTQQFTLVAPNTIGIFDWHGDIGDDPVGQANGNPSVTGSVTYDPADPDGPTYTVTGAGGDIWDNRDRCHIAAKEMPGDFIIQAFVNWIDVGNNTWSKAGVMVRKSIDSHDPMGIEGFRNPANTGDGVDTIFQWRDTNDGGAAWGGAARDNAAPGWVRIIRRGDVLTGQYFDGANWIDDTVHVVPGIAPDDAVVACIAVTSHSDDGSGGAGAVIAEAEFITVSILPFPIRGATRDIDATSFTVGTTINVTITLDRAAAGDVNITETVPTGWTVSNTNPSASVAGNVVTWTAIGGDTVSYTVTPDSTRFPGAFDGGVLDSLGVTTPITGEGVVPPNDRTSFLQGFLPDTTYAGTSDAHIIMYQAGDTLDQNTGAHDYIEEGDWYGIENPFGDTDPAPGFDDNKLILLRFQLQPIIPSGASVDEAWLRIFYDFQRRGLGSPPVSLIDHYTWAHAVAKQWGEGDTANGVDGDNAETGECSWSAAQTDILNWEAGGARGASDILDPATYSAQSTQMYGVTPDVWVEYDVTDIVAVWAANPSQNRGLKISQDDLGTTSSTGYHFGAYDFRSSEHANGAFRPTLTVKYTKALNAKGWHLYR